jgi:hypothetical protein
MNGRPREHCPPVHRAQPQPQWPRQQCEQQQRHRGARGVELPQPRLFGDHPHVIVGKANQHGIDQDHPGGFQRGAHLCPLVFPTQTRLRGLCAPETDMNPAKPRRLRR